ncbi:MAG: hypothetical protein RLZZ397_1048 [Pseudomonadota bacterium]|jgi:cell division protein FtsN
MKDSPNRITVKGFAVGLLVGLLLAALLAIYVTNAPVPFVDRGVVTKPGQELDPLKSQSPQWNPNSAVDQTHRPTVGAAETAPAAGNDPIAQIAQQVQGAPGVNGAPDMPTGPEYFVQAGAFVTAREADTQKARLTLLGLNAQVFPAEQSGQTFFRVRIGPFPDRKSAASQRDQLVAERIDATVVIVQPNDPAR